MSSQGNQHLPNTLALFHPVVTAHLPPPQLTAVGVKLARTKVSVTLTRSAPVTSCVPCEEHRSGVSNIHAPYEIAVLRPVLWKTRYAGSFTLYCVDIGVRIVGVVR